jgi:hypothetical protein
MPYLVGLDLGQSSDYTAIVIAESHTCTDETLLHYRVRHLERLPLGTSYPQVVTRVQALLATPVQVSGGTRYQRHPLHEEATLVVDYTGVGRPVVDMLEQAGLRPVPVSIHGGDRVSHDGRWYRTPKRDLVAAVQVLLHAQRLRIAEALPLARTLMAELLNFKVTIDPVTAHDSYSAWREHQHDDLVLALALACWWGEYRHRQRIRAW